MKKFSSFLVVLLLMLASFTAGMEYPRGDVNYDNQVDIEDVTCLINYVLNGTWPEEPVTPPDTDEYVDLGLPSGTLWATKNVGANVPEEFGDYFAWGETEPKEVYDWSTYKWCNGSDNTLTKYCNKTDYGYDGYIDDKSELDPEDDAAYVHWGSSWRMPTYDQLIELYENCTKTWTTLNGVNGCLLTGPNGNTLFLPAAGSRHDSTLGGEGVAAFYWSRTLGRSYLNGAYLVCIASDDVVWYNYHHRDYGFPVRPVRVSQN